MTLRRSTFAPVLACCLAISGAAVAQTIPNAGFEQWSDGNPVGWATNNSPPAFVPVTQTTDARSGFAVQGTTTSLGIGIGLPPSLLTDPGFPITTKPAALHGWCKLNLGAGDLFYVNVVFQKNGAGVGAGGYTSLNPTTEYREFVAVTSIPGDNPDTVQIGIAIAGSGGYATIGSFFKVDDISWGAATDVNTSENGLPLAFSLEQNYPNPFNPTTTIIYQIPAQSHVALKVFDALGREVATLVNSDLGPGRYKSTLDAGRLASGTYLYRLQAGSFVQTRRLVLVR